jgi:hypothetical protein
MNDKIIEPIILFYADSGQATQLENHEDNPDNKSLDILSHRPSSIIIGNLVQKAFCIFAIMLI